MADHEHPSKKKRSKRNWMCYLLIIVSVLFIAWPFITWGILGIADRLFEGINFPETSRFGISGDMYGALNALFAGFAFICFIYALYQQRLELQLQRRELSLQRRELKAQCREQERQANEFEAQNNLMQIQQFESFFYQQISLIKNLQNDVQVFHHRGRDAINNLLNNWKKISEKLDFVIKCVNDAKKGKFIGTGYIYGDDYTTYQNFDPDINCGLKLLGIQIKKIRPSIDSMYNFILLVINEKCLDDRKKERYLSIIKNIFLEEDVRMLYDMGRLLNYDKIIDYLLSVGVFDRENVIDKISKEKIQFIQNEMKLKSNPSLESCEINL